MVGILPGISGHISCFQQPDIVHSLQTDLRGDMYVYTYSCSIV